MDVLVSDNSPHAAIANPQKRMYGLQFHPEVRCIPSGAREVFDGTGPERRNADWVGKEILVLVWAATILAIFGRWVVAKTGGE